MLLRDVTKFKELDTMKSEFVATVSHDLRSSLTLMRGYATMLEMVGDLNNQQQNYVKKIVTGVESTSRLVNTLLDLGLAIVRSIAENHGDKVWVESNLGKGSTFFPQIPLMQPKKDQRLVWSICCLQLDLSILCEGLCFEKMAV
ncbi:MAG: hypothetical protein M1485_06170 [Chloroflexi bacterium]|nr:hypothetical protein [Chloroflexota bacterium]